MIKRSEYNQAAERAVEILRKTGLTLLPHELENQLEVADFGLSEIWISGAQIITLANTERLAVKLLVMLPDQTEPEHTHKEIEDYPGKEETVRCEWGTLYMFAPGVPTPNPKGSPPAHRRETYTVWHETIMRPGDQLTFAPNTPHWFQGGPEGAVIWSFSTKVVDAKDVFTDPNIKRETVIVDD